VGGTNPSLLEAMSSYAVICAHNNDFNKAILKNDAFYFNCSKCITALLNKESIEESKSFIENNIEKINTKYNWKKILDEYESFILSKL